MQLAAVWLECCLQVTLLPLYEDLEDKVTWNLLSSVTGGMGNVIKSVLQKMLDNVSCSQSIIREQFHIIDVHFLPELIPYCILKPVEPVYMKYSYVH